MTRQCPKCGKPASKSKPFINGFCTACYFEQHPLIVLRREPEAKICPRCQAYYASGRWVHQTTEPDEKHLEVPEVQLGTDVTKSNVSIGEVQPNSCCGGMTISPRYFAVSCRACRLVRLSGFAAIIQKA